MTNETENTTEINEPSESPIELSQWDTLAAALLTEFTDVKTRPVGGRDISYIDARQVMNRLDTVLGMNNWTDEYTLLDLNSGAVECALSIHFANETVTHRDVGYPPNNNSNDKLKASYSDSLKRAAVKFGIGRHLYEDSGTNWDEENSGPPPSRPELPVRQYNDDAPPIGNSLDSAKEAPKCANDGSTMVKRNGVNGPFWGCPQYGNGCRYTQPVGTFDDAAPSRF